MNPPTMGAPDQKAIPIFPAAEPEQFSTSAAGTYDPLTARVSGLSHGIGGSAVVENWRRRRLVSFIDYVYTSLPQRIVDTRKELLRV